MITANRNSVVPRRLNIGFVVEKKVALMVDDQLSDVNRYSVGEGIWLRGPDAVEPILKVFAILFYAVHLVVGSRRFSILAFFIGQLMRPSSLIHSLHFPWKLPRFL